MKPFTIKDLFDEDKNKKLEQEINNLKEKINKEKTKVIYKKMEKTNNAAKLNQLGQEGTQFLKWSVELED